MTLDPSQLLPPPPGSPSVVPPNHPAAPVKHGRLFNHIRSSMFSGLITLVPLFITIYLLVFLYGLATFASRPVAQALAPISVNILYPPPSPDKEAELDIYNARVKTITAWTSPILALLITIIVVYILGVLSYFTLGRRILAQFEHFIENLPLIKGIYGTTKQVIGVFRQSGGGQGFQRVVLVQFPRAGTWAVAFVTNTLHDDATNEQLVCCFIPMTPNPTSGFFQMFPEKDLRPTDWTVDMGIKIILSGGLLAPSNLHTGPITPATFPPAPTT